MALPSLISLSRSPYPILVCKRLHIICPFWPCDPLLSSLTCLTRNMHLQEPIEQTTVQGWAKEMELSSEKVSARLQPATAGHARLVLSKPVPFFCTSLYMKLLVSHYSWDVIAQKHLVVGLWQPTDHWFSCQMAICHLSPSVARTNDKHAQML